MTVANNEIKQKRKRIWHGIVTALAAIVVFVTTYALIIPAITWEKTLICPVEEHVHSEGCYDPAGELTCGKDEHKHTDACFDAPKAAEKLYICGKAEHTHSADCFFADGTLKCTLPEHRHTLACRNNFRTLMSDAASDGAIAVISGVLPENAQAEITAVPLSENELAAYFGAEKAAQMTGYVAYDIRIMVDGTEWQPNETVSVTVRHPELEMGGGNRLNLAHVEDGTDNVTDVEVQKNADGDVVFNADGFSLYIFYTSFTVDFHYEGANYSMNGRTAMRLGTLLTELGIDSGVAGVQSVVFSSPALLCVEPVDGDWLLTSLEPFDTDEMLTVTFNDDSTMIIGVTDPPAGGETGDTKPTNPCDQYLTDKAANDWQIVSGGFEGNEHDDKIVTNAEGDTKKNVAIQKNVVPTGNENEFLVYLSIDRKMTLEEFFNKTTIAVTSSNSGKFASTVIGDFWYDKNDKIGEGIPGSVSEITGDHDNNSGANEYYVFIEVYEKSTDTTPLYIYQDSRYGTTPQCQNGTLFLGVAGVGPNGETGYIVAQRSVSLQKNHNYGPGQSPTLKFYLDGSNVDYDFCKEKSIFDGVTDLIADDFEFLEIVYADGDIVDTNGQVLTGTGIKSYIDANDNTLLWKPEDKDDLLSDFSLDAQPPTNVSGYISPAADLVYKVRLKTEEEDFNSCADHMNDAVDAYAVNDEATLQYHYESISGIVNPIPQPSQVYTATFSVPYVRGLNYDLRFKKVSNTGKALPGAVFRLLDENGQPLKDINGNEYPDVVSGPDGCVNIQDLPVLPTYIREVSAPIGYQLPTNNTFGPLKKNYTVCSTTERSSCFTRETEDYPDNMRNKQNDSSSALWQISNVPAPGRTVVFKKVDSETQAAIRGVQFALYGSDVNGKMNTNPLPGYENLVSLWNGIFSPDELSLPYGTYYLKETAARSGYLELTAPIRIDVTSSDVSVTGTDGSPSVSYEGSVYTVTIRNVHEEEIQPIFVPDDPEEVIIKKQIDWLGGDQGVTGMDDLYRLYLSLQTSIEPMDLLLVIDQSTSMLHDVSGNAKYLDEAKTKTNPECDFDNVRQDLIIDFLNGTGSDGFISQYLDANAQNRLAILTFGSDCSYSDSRYIRHWDSTARSVSLDPNPDGATNYAAALDVASVILKESSDSAPDKRRVMIFLSDGVPTFAYADGRMHRSFDYEMVGSGNNYSTGTAVGLVNTYIILHTPGAVSLTWEDFINDRIIYSGGQIVDDLDNPYTQRYHFIEPFSPLINNPSQTWPVTYDLTTMVLNIPGTNFPEAGITDQTAFNTFKAMWNDFTDDEKQAWVTEHIEYPGDSYDIFDLTKSAFNEFSIKNPNVPVFSILFSSEDGSLESERPDNEVLLHMSGDEHPDAPEGRYQHYQRCEDGETLAAVIKGIAGLSKVKITDPLSDYVDFETDPAHPERTVEKTSQLEIKLKDEAYSSYYEEGKDYAYLYQDGDFTALGRLLLDTTATKIDAGSKTVKVVFNDKHIYSGEFCCEASFNVRVNETAKMTYILEDYNATGEDDTDYPGNDTSTGMPGFYSNEGASAEWIYYGDDGDDYNKPVVQVHPIEIRLEKVNNRKTKLSGAEFNLFLEVAEDTTGRVVYTDQKGNTHYLLRLNTDSMVSENTDPISVGKMFDGTYYLFETKAPDGYSRLTSPVVFELDSKAILTADKNAEVDENDSLLLSIVNTCGGELPPTGGIGTKPIYTLGILLIAGALMAGIVLRCKFVGKGRQE